MKVLVAGAPGFLGKHLVQKLVARGDKVSALVWPTNTCSVLQNLPVTIIERPVQNADLVMRAAQGQDVVFHCAGKVADWGPRSEYYQVNVEGTRNMLEASRAAEGKHFIHISSLVVLGIPDTAPVNETMPYTTKCFNPYMETKLISEKMVIDYHNQNKLPVTVIRPGIPWGPGDTSIFPRLERLASRGLMIFKIGSGDNALCLSCVPNLVDALLLAADVKKPDGQIYHVVDEGKITSGAYFAALTQAIGAKRPAVPILFSVLYITASAI